MENLPSTKSSLGDFRVLLVCATVPPAFSGAGDFFYKYAERLEQRGQLALLVTHSHEDEDYPAFHAELDVAKVVRMPMGKLTNPNALRRITLNLWWFCELFIRVGWLLWCERQRYDIVHVCSTSWLCMFALFWGRAFGKAAVYETSLVGQDDPLYIHDHHRRLRYWLLTRADAYVAMSPALADLCVQAGICKEHVFTIGNSVDVALYRPTDEATKRAFRSKLGVPEHGPIIVFVGGIIERKGADLFPEIFRHVLEKFPDATLILAGKEDWPAAFKPVGPRIRAELCEHVAAGQVVFTGTVSNVHEYLRASDVFLFPSRREGFGTVQVEAMACGLPCVAHNIEGITPFIIEHGVDGVIIENENPTSYADAIIRLLSDEAEYGWISRRAREKAVNCFSAEVIDRQYRTMYEEVLAKKGIFRVSPR